MKLGVFMNLFSGKKFDDALNQVKELGFEAIEIGAGNFAGKEFCNPEELLQSTEKLNEFIEKINSRGLFISALNCSGNPLHPNKKFADSHINDLELAMELAHRLGITVVNSFAGCPGADENSLVPNWITCPWPSYYADAIKWQWEKKILPFWNKMAKKASRLNLKIGFEMHPGDSVYNPELLLMLREKIGSDSICCNLDPSHLFWQGIDPIISIKKLKDLIVHVHAKDTKIDDDVVRYRGVLDWKHYSDVINRAWSFRTVGYGNDLKFWNSFFSTLRIINFDGVISIEHEDPLMSVEEGLLKAINFLKNSILFKKPTQMWWA